MIQAMLIDDEVHSLDALHILLSEYCPQVEVVAMCRSGSEAIGKIHELGPQLLFLDIEMPNMTGFELLSRVKGQELDVIFTTAYNQYAINAIRIEAMDYLLKPVDEEELVHAVQRAEERIKEKISSKQIDVLITNIKGVTNEFQKLAIPTQEGLHFVNIHDICYCSGEGNYTHIVTSTGAKHLISKTLKGIEEMLSHPSFFRTHQSYLVNLHYIKQYIRGSGGYLILHDGTTIQVARSRKEALMRVIYK
jgi:two-component system LytT family response regulator